MSVRGLTRGGPYLPFERLICAQSIVVLDSSDGLGEKSEEKRRKNSCELICGRGPPVNVSTRCARDSGYRGIKVMCAFMPSQRLTCR